MDINNICPKCMKPMGAEDDFCAHCGYRRGSNENSSNHALKPFTILQGKYLVGNVIGEGGFGITYIGLDLNLEIRIAIKEFYPNGFVTRESEITSIVTNYTNTDNSQYEKWKDSFVQEARSLARFSNLPGIVHVRDFFQENNTAYIVIEYVEGQKLKTYLSGRGGRISVQDTLNMMLPVIQSLAKVHAAQIIHRDISPDNIMIQEDGVIKLIDFGAARDFGTADEKSMSVLLKPGFAPEEQYRSKGNQGPWTDVYALCATIYRCITGEKPPESMERMREDTLKKPSVYGIQISPSEEAAILGGLEVFAEKRIKTMGELEAKLYNVKVQTVTYTQMTAPPAQTFVQEIPQVKTKKPIYLAVIAALITAVILLVVVLVVNLNSQNTNTLENDLAMNTEGNKALDLQGQTGTVSGQDENNTEFKAEETVTAQAESVSEEAAAEEKKAEEDKKAQEEKKKQEEDEELKIHSYEIVNADVSWIEAYEACINRGGYLVNINSYREFEAIKNQIIKENREEYLFYVGALRDPYATDGTELEYHWVRKDGSLSEDILNGYRGNSIYRIMWADGEPGFGSDDGRGNQYIENFVDLIRLKNKDTGTYRYCLNDIPSDVLSIVPAYAGNIAYICEYDD